MREMETLLPILLVATSSTLMGQDGHLLKDNVISTNQRSLCELGCNCVDGQSIFLDCARKNITELPPMIRFAPETEDITFEENFLQNIANNTFLNGANITELDLSHNRLTEIEDFTFRSFSSLTILRLSSNNFTSLSPNLLQGLTHLKILELGHNELEQLPDDFFIHTLALQELKLQFNKLHSLPPTTFKYLNRLEKLDLGGNNLLTLPENLFRPTPRLQSLSLASNDFRRVPRAALLKATYLHLLDLSNNKFEILHSNCLSSLRNVSLLYLNDLLRLRRVEKAAFSNMPRLKILSCSYNPKLSYFDPEAFGEISVDKARLYPKEQLILRRNGLKTLPIPLRIDTWSKLNHIDLSENPWKCDCKIRWMRILKSNTGDNMRCESPFPLHGRKIVSLTDSEMVCEEHWMFSTIILMSTSISAFFVCSVMVLLIVCSHSRFRRLRLKSQFSYRKFIPKKEDTVDLDWDPTSMM